MSFLCTTRNKEVSYHQCINECQYFFKSACIDGMNEAYNQALEDVLRLIATLGIDWEVKNSDIDWLEKSVERLRKEKKYDSSTVD